MALSIVEHNWALMPVPKNPDIREAQHLMGDGDGNKNHFIRSNPEASGHDVEDWVTVDLSSTEDITRDNEPVYYIYDRYAKLVRM
jgi:hypothetical protein